MITAESKIMINGAIYDMAKFKEKFNIDTDEKAIEIANILVNRGKASEYVSTTKEKRILEDAMKQEMVSDVVKKLDEEKEANRQAKRQKNLDNTESLSILLDADTQLEAMNMEKKIHEMIGAMDTEIVFKDNALKVRVRNITPNEYAKIARVYSADRTSKAFVNSVDKATGAATDAINYGATHIVAPVAQIGAKAGMNIGKAVVHTALKTGAGIVTAGSKAIKETKYDLVTDPEMIRAKNELNSAGNAISRYFKSKFGTGTGKGISIE